MRFRVSFVYGDGQMKVYLKTLFLRFELYGDKKSKIRKKDFKIKKFRRRRDKVLKKYKIKGSPLGELRKKLVKAIKKLHHGGGDGKPKTSPLIMIKDIKAMLWDTVRLLGRNHRIDRFDLAIDVGGKDASAVALNYGYVIQAVQYAVTFLEFKTNLAKTKRKSATVNADFATESWNARLNVQVSLRTIDILMLTASAIKGYFKHKLQKNAKRQKNKKDGK